MTSSRAALALLVTLALALACDGKSAAPSYPESTAVIVTGTPPSAPPPTSTASPGPSGTPYARPTPQAISVADDEVWREVAAEAAGHLAPLLRPAWLPDGLETVTSNIRERTRAEDRSVFLVEYGGPATRVRLLAGALNAAPPPISGHQQPRLVRGHEVYLMVDDDSQPSLSSWAYWREPGLWKPEGQTSGAPWLEYEVIVEGLSPEELLSFVEALQPWTPE